MPRGLRVSLVLLLVCSLELLLRAAWGLWTHPQPRIALTLLASLLLLVAAGAGLRGRVWGVLLAFLTAASFAGVVVFGVAPDWFVGVAVLGSLPLAQVALPLYRRDRAAFALGALLALAAGALAAVVAGPGVSWLCSL